MNPDDFKKEDALLAYEFKEEYLDTLDELNLDRETVLKVGKSMMDDIDDRINHEFMFPSTGITAQSNRDEIGRKRFRTIPEE